MAARILDGRFAAITHNLSDAGEFSRGEFGPGGGSRGGHQGAGRQRGRRPVWQRHCAEKHTSRRLAVVNIGGQTKQLRRGGGASCTKASSPKSINANGNNMEVKYIPKKKLKDKRVAKQAVS